MSAKLSNNEIQERIKKEQIAKESKEKLKALKEGKTINK